MNNKHLRSRRNINKYDNGKNSTQLGDSIGDIAGNAFGFLGSAIERYGSYKFIFMKIRIIFRFSKIKKSMIDIIDF